MESEKQAASEWAESLLAKGFLILDTETTGLDYDDEIIEIAIITHTGKTLLNTRLKPRNPERNRESGAERFNHINADELTNYPTFEQIYDCLVWLLTGRHVVIYNANFDLDKLQAHYTRAGLPPIRFRAHCAMLKYAAFYGDWSEYHEDFRWQPLNGDHSALGDCLATLELIKLMSLDK